MGLSYGFILWVYTMGLSYGFISWVYPMHFNNRFISWVYLMGLSYGSIQCILLIGLSHGSCRESYPMGCSSEQNFIIFVVLHHHVPRASPCPRHPVTLTQATLPSL
jgi:hypothetical protein